MIPSSTEFQKVPALEWSRLRRSLINQPKIFVMDHALIPLPAFHTFLTDSDTFHPSSMISEFHWQISPPSSKSWSELNSGKLASVPDHTPLLLSGFPNPFCLFQYSGLSSIILSSGPSSVRVRVWYHQRHCMYFNPPHFNTLIWKCQSLSYIMWWITPFTSANPSVKSAPSVIHQLTLDFVMDHVPNSPNPFKSTPALWFQFHNSKLGSEFQPVQRVPALE